YHFGPGLLLGVVLLPFVDLSTIIIASVILDLEPLTVLMLQLPLPFHGFFHTYLGATIVACVLSLAIFPFRGYLNKIVSIFGLHQESSFRQIFPASIIGTYSHVLLDSILYAEMNPFFPLIGNPFLGLFQLVFIYNICIFFGIVGFGVYLLRILYNQYKPRQTGSESDVFS
ncbi:MAG: hypothetical protein ACTSYJ_10175, partial [Candidatus Thorarchaeota archaeon]